MSRLPGSDILITHTVSSDINRHHLLRHDINKPRRTLIVLDRSRETCFYTKKQTHNGFRNVVSMLILNKCIMLTSLVCKVTGAWHCLQKGWYRMPRKSEKPSSSVVVSRRQSCYLLKCIYVTDIQYRKPPNSVSCPWKSIVIYTRNQHTLST